MLKRMTITLLAHRPTGGISPSSSALVTHSPSTVLFANVVGSSLFRPVGGAQLGASPKFQLPGNVFEGRRGAIQFQRYASPASGEGLADVMRVKKALAAETEATDSVMPDDTEIREDDDEASKLKVRITILNSYCIVFQGWLVQHTERVLFGPEDAWD